MAQGYNDYLIGVRDGSLIPAVKADGRMLHAKLYTWRAKLDLSKATVAKVNGDTNLLFGLPPGFAFAYGILNASATMGASTLAIGVSGTAGKYRAAATFTAAAPTLFGTSTAADDGPLTAAEDVLLTIGAADLPGAGILLIDFYGSMR